MMNTELLAPVGSMEALIAAVQSGADAVYLSGKQFGARHYAANFTNEELVEAVRYAHLRGVDVHVTVNTLIDESEMPELAAYLPYLYQIGVDAIIVQDLGVARVAQKVAPNLTLHASTQMSVHNLEGVKALADFGFSRVVLAREMTLPEIRHICQNSPIEIEVFIHGALCVCYSGQCLMSSLIGGRSGNRGRCAQPCRLPYDLLDHAGNNVLENQDSGQYLLSPKDLNALELLPELVEAGVASFKIEGRMKRPEYVAIVVDTYRRNLDSVLHGSRPEHVDEQKKEMAQVFNRDFTTAYLEKKQGRLMMSDRRPNNRGVRIGRVAQFDPKTKQAVIHLDEPIHVDDVLEVWVKVGGRVSITVKELYVNGQSVSEAKAGENAQVTLDGYVKIHDRVFKTYDSQLMARAKQFFEKPDTLRKLGIKAEVWAQVGESLKICFTDEEGFKGQAETEFIGQAAIKRPLSVETLQKQLERLGNTMFRLTELVPHIEGDVMIPVSELNEVRRKAIELLEEERLKIYARSAAPNKVSDWRKFSSFTQGKNQQKPDLVVQVDRLNKVESALRSGCDIILFGGESYDHRVITTEEYEQALQLVRQSGKKIYFNTPRLVKENQLQGIGSLLQFFDQLKPDGVSIGNLGVWQIAKAYPLSFQADYALNAFNSQAIAFFAEQGFQGVTLSPELNFGQIEKLADQPALPLECIVHGALTMMISEYCVIGSFVGGIHTGQCSQPCLKEKFFLRDRMNAQFPLRTDQYCRMHILNSKDLSMIPHVPKFLDLNIRRLRIEAKAMNESEIKKTVKLYRELIDQGENHPLLQKENYRELEGDTFTRGHYFRGIL